MMEITPGSIPLADLRVLARERPAIRLEPGCWDAVDRGSARVGEIVAREAPAYGINTGFGKLANRHIARADLEALQRNLVLSHAVGVGPLLEPATVRLVLVLKAASLARGYSGVRRAVVERLLDLHRLDCLPCVPAQGSVGASGDLAPLAHLTLPLLGLGEVDLAGERLPTARALARLGVAPLELAAKEGLALINGTQVSCSLALQGLFAAERLAATALVAGALSVDAARGSDTPFDARLQEIRGHRGQSAAAGALRALLAGSEIRRSHLVNDERVQDPYSLRCQPQVVGACLDSIRHAAGVLAIEANSVSDNPVVFAGAGEVLSGGNFHAEPVALVADALALAIAEIGALAERRIALLIDATLSGLPPFLTRNPGLHSGFMMAHVTAAALASENKSLAHPASVDSLPTSANQEDHVSMATFAARRLEAMARNTATIVAIELLAAAQGVEFHRPLRSSAALETVHASIRGEVPALGDDRSLAPDIEAVTRMVLAGSFEAFAGGIALG
jgi:histidine ammonia-lyase